MRCYFKKLPTTWSEMSPTRRGVFLVVGAICMIAALAITALAVDIGVAALKKSQMQAAVDSASLAGAMEITNALANGGNQPGDVFAYAQAQARIKAAAVAQMNNVYVASTDVSFGRRYYDSSSQTYKIDWTAGANQTNVVKVSARRDGSNTSAPDGKVPSLFATSGTTIRTDAVAFVDPRDLIIVQDFSRSMNFDSYFTDEVATGLTQSQIEDGLAMVWSDLQPLTLGTLPYAPQYFSQAQTSSSVTGTVTFKGTSVAITSTTGMKSVVVTFTNNATQTFTISGTTTKTGTYAGTGSSNSGKRISSVAITAYKVGSTSQTVALPTHTYTATSITAKYGLTTYPYAGGSWAGYVSYVQTSTALPNYGYLDMYGGMTFLCYVMKSYPEHSANKDLWKTRHYPFQACKDGQQLLCDYLTQLGFDDHLGMVSYDTNHRMETTLNDTNPAFPVINISANPVTKDYATVAKLMQYKQAAYYSDATNMGGGMKDAITMLDTYKRDGSRPAIILMTDGQANTIDSGDSSALPSGWNWNTMFDYNGDGAADYTTTDSNAKYVLAKVKIAIDKGYTVHTVSVGSVADRNLMKAAAWLGKGYWLDVPAGTTVASMSDQMRTVFSKIASAVPPARLVPTN
ncbi:MAG: von Willebrand factor type domain protein [Schlesneria sp.]|nr:von Willebrand factor type domain protein [Schlesneria sp.]